MTIPEEKAVGRAATMRHEFDSSFARLPQTEKESGENLICFRVSDTIYAMQLNDTAGILVDKVITAIPSEIPEFLGITSHRGELIPVYSMPRLLGHREGKTGRWLFLLRASHVLALTFDNYEGHYRASTTDIVPVRDTRPGGACIQYMTHINHEVCPIVSVPELLHQIEKKNGLSGKIKEA